MQFHRLDESRRITSLLIDNQLKLALESMNLLVQAHLPSFRHHHVFKTQELKGILDKIEELDRILFYRLSYLMDGVEDKQSEIQRKQLIGDAIELNCRIELLILDNEERIAPLDSLSLAESLLTDPITHRPITEQEKAEQNLFDRFVCPYPLTRSRYEVWASLLADVPLSSDAEAMAISALTLASLSCFDPLKIHLLLSHSPRSRHAAARRMIGIYLNKIYFNPIIPYFVSLSTAFDTIFNDTESISMLRIIGIEMERTRQTEVLSRKVRDEIMPGILKAGEKMKGKIDPNRLISDLENGEMNPEWMELLQSEGTENRIMELNELQSQGADLYWATFSSLKNNAFFNLQSNWFKPFQPSHSTIASIDSSFFNLLRFSPGLCDSDKYSLAFTLGSIPENMRQSFKGQFEGITPSETASADHTAEIRSSIQDLYRYQHLNHQGSSLQLIDYFCSLPTRDLPHLSPSDYLLQLALFNFESGQYESASLYFEVCIELLYNDIDATTMQKAAFSFEMSNRTAQALTCYLQLLEQSPADLWSLKRTVRLLRREERHEEVLSLLRQAEPNWEEDPWIAFRIGKSLVQIGQPDAALNYFFKAEFLAPESIDIYRQIAWCSFSIGKYTQAQRYYDLIHSMPEAIADDFYRAACTELAINNLPLSISLFRKGVNKENCTFEQFNDTFRRQYVSLLEDKGIASTLLCEITNLIQYEF